MAGWRNGRWRHARQKCGAPTILPWASADACLFLRVTAAHRRLNSKIDKKKQAIAKVELQARSKEDLKTVALGTSKINYMDPRITVAWCKRNEVPIEKIFNKSLLAKFNWAMDVDPTFRF